MLVQQRADDPLARAVAVDGGRVEQRAAGIEEQPELLLGRILVDRRTPGHRPEREPRHLETRVPKPTHVHATRLWVPKVRV